MEENLKKVFTQIKQDNHWGDADSVSGTGSNLSQTDTVRKVLPLLLQEYGIKQMVDAPCGDFFWMKEILPELESILDRYEGLDIVEEVVLKNSSSFASSKMSFSVADITSSKLPIADLIFTRDCLVHLSFKNIWKVIKNYKKSGIKYLLTTTFTDREENKDIVNGDWRPLNLQKEPFFFPKPLVLINENCTEDDGIYTDKSLALWEIDKLTEKNKISFYFKKYLK